ncbi:MAG: dolichyl-phosphate beta-glucosyltransferase [Thermoanaerobaculia bacterium]
MAAKQNEATFTGVLPGRSSTGAGPNGIRRAITVVIPAYNEEARLPRTLETIDRFLRGAGYQAEILVVDDGSTDRTRESIAELEGTIRSLRLLSYAKNRGKGYAVMTGVLAATAPVVLFSDADLSTPIEELDRLWTRYESGYDVVIASRNIPESELEVEQPLHRKLVGRTFNLVIGILAIRGFRDTQCGFKLLRTEPAQRIFRALRTERFAFDVEILLRARRLGLKISEVPVRWKNSPDSRVHVVRDSARMLIEVLRMRRFV